MKQTVAKEIDEFYHTFFDGIVDSGLSSYLPNKQPMPRHFDSLSDEIEGPVNPGYG